MRRHNAPGLGQAQPGLASEVEAPKIFLRIGCPISLAHARRPTRWSTHDERNPLELGIIGPALKRIGNARLYPIRASGDTRGHGTTGLAKFWKEQLQEFLQTVPRRAMQNAT